MNDNAASQILEALERCRAQSPNILEGLQILQERFGYVPLSAVPELAHALGVSEADIAGTLSYYPELHTRPAGRHQVRLCMGEACVANHCERLLSALRDSLGVGLGETTPDARFSLDRIYCVGNCGVGPTVMIDEDVHGRVAPSDVAALLDHYE